MKKLFLSFLITLGMTFLYGQVFAGSGLDIQPSPYAAPILYPPENESRSISWNENLDIYIQIGKPDMPIHENVRRCILADDGTVVYYLNGYNREGVTPSTTGFCVDEAEKKLVAFRAFIGPASDYVGHYAHNIDTDTYSLITAKDSDDALSLQDDIFTTYDTFEICTGVFNGDDGQVMVEIPAFYYKYQYYDGWHSYSISLNPLSGYNLHPAFYKNGVDVEARYIGAYEGVLYDTSSDTYINGLYLPSDTAHKMSFNGATETITSDTLTHPFTNLEAGVDTIVISGAINNNLTCGIIGVTDTTITVDCDLEDESNVACIIQTQRDWSKDILSSVAGKAPITHGTRANFRTVAANRGTGWRQMDFDLMSAIQLLYLIEYGSFNSQSSIGAGLTDWDSSWLSWNNNNPIEKTGLSNGNPTKNVTNGDGVKGSYVSYRWIENPWGHLYKWVDGISVYNCVPYVCNNDAYFTDEVAPSYTSLGVILPSPEGYQKTLLPIGRGFLPNSLRGHKDTHIGDYYAINRSGWRVAMSGGSAHSGAMAGAFYLDIEILPEFACRNITGRLCY